MRGWLQDLRDGFRTLIRQPIITSVVVITLALGIGANTAIFTLLDAILLRRLPVSHPSSLVAIHCVRNNGQDEGLSLEIFEELKRHQGVFSGMAGWTTLGATTEANGTVGASTLDGVTGEYFSLLGIHPLLGTLIQPDDNRTENGSPTAVAVISYRFWHQRYDGDWRVLGKVVHVQGIPFTIIGIAPRNYTGLQVGISTDITVPLSMIPQVEHGLNMTTNPAIIDYALARLKHGVTIAEARADLESLWPDVRAAVISRLQQGTDLQADRIVIEPASTGFSSLRRQFSKSIVILLAIAGAVLLLACLNLAGLMAARAASRTHELGVRIALGATRWRLVRRVLTETIVLAAIGTLLGVWFAYWGSRLLAEMIIQIYSVTSVLSVAPDARVLIFSAAAAIGTGVFTGLVPAWRATRADPRAILQEGPRTIAPRRSGVGKILIIVQMALALVLLDSAGLFIGTLTILHRVPLGFRARNTIEVQLLPKPDGYRNFDEPSYYHELAERLASLPGVVDVAMSNMSPGAGFQPTVTVARQSASQESLVPSALGLITPRFFRTMGMHLLQGRDFTWHDAGQTERVSIISEGLAQKLFPGENALDQQIRVGHDPARQNVRIVGIVNDARISDIHRLQVSSVFLPSAQEAKGSMEFPVVEFHMAGDSRGLAGAVNQIVGSMGREYVLSTQSAEQIIDLLLIRERITAMLSGFFAGLALLLAAIGLFGLLSYTVTRRSHEIAIRMALGAQSGGMLKMILQDTLVLVFSGVMIGLLCAMATSRIVASLLFGISPRDPYVLTAVCAALLLIGLFAGYVPARRATRVDPMSVLRHE